MTNQPTFAVATYQRVIRVFVSSTFRDMQAEREELVKRIFPQLRKLCEKRGVTWSDVDLRWGITNEQTAEGKVLPICLAEIEHSRPYFIGLLGERYGWVPDDIDEELVSEQPWLKEHKEKSITELEIIHGVLKNPDMADHAFFYFRDPEISRQIEDKLSREPDYQPEPDTSREKLRLLKKSIEQSRFPVQRDYPDIKKLGELVLRDLTEVIDRLYPEGSQPAPLDRDATDHEAFAQSRARVYIGRDEYFKRLDEHVNSDNPPLVVLGESGSGKSALLSNWALKFRKENANDLLLIHFIGASPYSADWAAMLRRIMGELKRSFDIQQDIPDKPDELRAAFANYLHMAAAKGRVILILDALNQLEDRDGAPDLLWLPPVIPSNIRLILSTLPGRPLDDLKKRGYQTMTVQPLNQEERKLFIEKYLAQYTKALSPARAERIANAGQTTNPLYLQALLEELRLFGRHEQLDERISYYLQAETVPALYEKILTRYEEDYEADKSGLVKDVMSCLWAARRGLSESELLDILGSDGSPLPKAVWSPLNLAAEHSLVNRSGLIGFSHDYLRQAVREGYLAAEEQQRQAHLRLANYFEVQETGHRKVDELPWQMARAKEWQRLAKALCDTGLFPYAMEHKQEYDWIKYWQLLRGDFDPANCYEAEIEEKRKQEGESRLVAMLLNHASRLLELMGSYESALSFRERAFSILEFKFGRYNPDLAIHLDNLANLHVLMGNYQKAEELNARGLSWHKESSDSDDSDTASFLNNRAQNLKHQGKASEAIPLAEQALNIVNSVRAPNHPDVALMLDNLSSLYHDVGDFGKALPLTVRALEIQENSKGPDHPDVGVCLNNLGMLYLSTKSYSRALSCFERSLQILENTLTNNHPTTAGVVSNIGLCYQLEGDCEQALHFLQKALSIEEGTLGEAHPSVAYVLFNMSYNLFMLRQPAKARDCCKRAVLIAQKAFGPEHSQTLLYLDRLKAFGEAMD